MREKIQITYRIDDGYAGGDRPQHVTISADEVWDILPCPQEKLEDWLIETVDEHFRMNTGVSVRSQEMARFVDWVAQLPPQDD